MRSKVRSYKLQVRCQKSPLLSYIFYLVSFSAKGAGFTLVELLVGLSILAVLTVAMILAFNPVTQINKAKDAVRMQDIVSINQALNTYYHDKNCYPSMSNSSFSTALKNGGEWKEGSTIYMKKVPKDPQTNGQFVYQTDGKICPQWNAIFSKLSFTKAQTQTCPLSKTGCVPAGYDSSWACVTSGITDCAVLASASLTGGNLQVNNGNQQGGTINIQPTPTPTPISSDLIFSVALPPKTNPDMYQGLISPLFQAVGKTQTLSIDVADDVANVTSVSATIKSDNKIQTYDLKITKGTPVDGTWGASWTVNDTTIHRFMISVNGVDGNGNTSNFDEAIR